MSILYLLPSMTAFTAMVMDLRTGKIENGWLLFSTVLSLLTMHVSEVYKDLPLLFRSGLFLSGFFLPVLIFFPLFVLRMLGAGDIKLFCVLGAFLGPGRLLHIIGLSFLTGGILSLVIMLRNHMFPERFSYLYHYIISYQKEKGSTAYISKADSDCFPIFQIHFTIPVFIAVSLQMGGLF